MVDADFRRVFQYDVWLVSKGSLLCLNHGNHCSCFNAASSAIEAIEEAIDASDTASSWAVQAVPAVIEDQVPVLKVEA